MDDAQLRAEPPTASDTGWRPDADYRPLATRPAAAGGIYSIFVGLMKWLLPGAAIVLIGVVMMWPQLERAGQQAERSVMSILSPEDVANIMLVNPRFTGVDELDRPYMLTADVARQANRDSDLVTLEGPKADITLEDGTWLALTADNGSYFQKNEELNLSGSVNIFQDQGYSLETSEARVNLGDGSAEGDMPVIATGPMGTLEAQGFRVFDQGETVIFKGKARLVLYPKEDADTGASGSAASATGGG